ncbi:hypothetical protein EDD11_009002 [Mortierella claussenii]|nr:hypothetical protein EDD11_009002 [Mortierella claussenii]
MSQDPEIAAMALIDEKLPARELETLLRMAALTDEEKAARQDAAASEIEELIKGGDNEAVLEFCKNNYTVKTKANMVDRYDKKQWVYRE